MCKANMGQGSSWLTNIQSYNGIEKKWRMTSYHTWNHCNSPLVMWSKLESLETGVHLGQLQYPGVI